MIDWIDSRRSGSIHIEGNREVGCCSWVEVRVNVHGTVRQNVFFGGGEIFIYHAFHDPLQGISGQVFLRVGTFAGGRIRIDVPGFSEGVRVASLASGS